MTAIRFLQRWAVVFGIIAANVASELILPADATFWLKIAVGIPFGLAVVLLLYKDGVTNRTRRR